MRSNGRVLATAVAGLTVAVTAGVLRPSPAQESPLPRRAGSAPDQAGNAKQEAPEAAAVRRQTAEFAAAFNKGDAKATAAFWMTDGEFIGPDGSTLRGRRAIEKGYAAFFKKNPKASLELHPESVRLYGHHAAVEVGTLTLRLPGANRHDPEVRRLGVALEIYIHGAEGHPLAIRGDRRLADTLQLHHIFEGEGIFGLGVNDEREGKREK